MTAERLTTHEARALRVLVLDRLRQAGILDRIPDAVLAERLGADRVNIWRDRQLLARADALVEELLAGAPWDQPAGLTVSQAAARLQCRVTVIRYRLRSGHLRGERTTTGRWRISEAEITRIEKRGGIHNAF